MRGQSQTSGSPFFRRVTPGIETLRSSFSLPRHRHLHAYATVVLAGAFDESGYIGRIRATAGDVLIHPTLDCHANRMISAGVKLIRLEWPDSPSSGGIYRIDEIDAIARVAEKDVTAAAALLREILLSETRLAQPRNAGDWPDELASALIRDRSMPISTWADAYGLANETVSRGFSAAYGISPSHFRAESRARAAWLRVVNGTDGLSHIAADTGFADQAHMTRWIHHITGAPPAAWRREAGGATRGASTSASARHSSASARSGSRVQFFLPKK